jgi:hypothetical protein
MTPQAFSFPGALSSTAVLDCLADGILVTDIGDGSRGPKIVYANPGLFVRSLFVRSPATRRMSLWGRARKCSKVLTRIRQSCASFAMTLTAASSSTDRRSTIARTGLPSRWSGRSRLLSARRLLKAEHAARTDALTGLPNRSHIDDVLDGGGWLNARAGAAVVVDIDNFKAINDTHGHVIATRSCERSQGASPPPSATEKSWPVGGVRSSAS